MATAKNVAKKIVKKNLATVRKKNGIMYDVITQAALTKSLEKFHAPNASETYYQQYNAFHHFYNALNISQLTNAYFEESILSKCNISNIRNSEFERVNFGGSSFGGRQVPCTLQNNAFIECDFKNVKLNITTNEFGTNVFYCCKNILIATFEHTWPLVLINHTTHTNIYCGCRSFEGKGAFEKACKHWAHYPDPDPAYPAVVQQRKTVVLPMLELLAQYATKQGWKVN